MFPGLKCILCHEEDTIALDLDDGSTFRCRECGDEFTMDTLREHLSELHVMIHQWQVVLAWIATAPKETNNESGTTESGA